MNFDEIIQTPCIIPGSATGGGSGGGGSDPGIIIPGGCSDPDYAADRPDECGGPNQPRLILKPEVSTLCVGNSVRYRASLVQMGVEVDLDSGLLFTSSDPTIGIIGAVSGSLTALAAGIISITVTWQNLTAHAQLQVGAADNCCGDIISDVVIVMDNSKSMSQAFGGSYATKLAYAKTLARAFVESMNLEKDSASIHSFNDGATEVLNDSQDETALVAAVNGIPSTLGSTDLTSGLQAAIDHLSTKSGQKIIVLLTDGVHRDVSDPEPVAQAFRDAGGIIIVVGIRAWSEPFALLNRLASGGFFLSGYPAVEEDTIDYLVGLKGYLCAGDCSPPGDVFASRPALNFTGFTKWDVIANEVDLIGRGNDGHGERFDFLPGHGLYVDMAGSGSGFNGSIRTKTEFEFIRDGVTDYWFKVKVAGNQRTNFTCGVRVQIGSFVDQVITPTSYTEDFVEYDIQFTPTPGPNEFAKIILTFSPGSGSGGSNSAFGCLVDDVILLENGVEIFSDDFDDENLQYIPPSCGEGGYESGGNWTYTYGYNCYGSGCLTVPPEAQVADPTALADNETGSGGIPFHYPRIPQ